MKRPKDENILEQLDVRLNGVFGELGKALVSALSQLEESGGEVKRSQTFSTQKGPLRAEAGVKVRVGGFDIDTSDVEVGTDLDFEESKRQKSAQAKEIDATIVQDAASWSLTAEMPGVSRQDFEYSLEEGCLELKAESQFRNYFGKFDLPEEYEYSDISVTLQNGILDIIAAKT